ncbi:hypothetical protein [uncultured Roseibium sp.]|uniref:hypothetical protein n=1 Tax=uncultured Roseibium sp. TaxID=1936171 RepID=UPI0032175B57
MLRKALIAMLCFLAPSAAVSGSALTPEYAANVFWEFRKLVPDDSAAEAYFRGVGFKLISKHNAEDKRYLEYADRSETLFAILDQDLHPPIANSLYLSVSTYGTDRRFVSRVIDILGGKLNRSDERPLESGDGWEDVGWVGGDKNKATVLISVAHNAEHHVTKIWSHQLRVGDE